MKKFALLSIIIFTLLAGAAGAFTMRSGYYVGNGVARSITGVGITPDLIIIKADSITGAPAGSCRAVWRSSTMVGDSTAYFERSDVGNQAGLITSIDSDGFSLGTGPDVNYPNIRYSWVVFSGSGGGDFKVGTYSGNGTDPRNITGIGFQPNLVWVKRDGPSLGVWYNSAMGADQSHYFSATAPQINRIQSLLADGFQVGDDPEVNMIDRDYHYVAFKAVAGSMTTEAYTVGASTWDNRLITIEGFNPDFVFVKRSSAANQAVLRSNQSYGDEAQYFTATNNAVNIIQTTEANGFQVGTDNTVNAVSSTYYYAAFRGVPAPVRSGTFKMISGSYLSTGLSRSITGLGFRPDLIMIKADNANFGVFTSSMMDRDSTAYFANAAVNFANGITSIDNDGFTIGTGTSATVNTAGITYRWVAMSGTPSTNFIAGAYTGTGGDNRSISGLGFQPDIVAVKGNIAQLGVFRTSSITGDNTAHFSNTVDTADIIQALEPDGFQVGTNTRVNTAATTYYYLAFKQTTGQCTVGAYVGNNTNNTNIDGLGLRPGLVWIKRPEVTTGAVFRANNITGDNSQFFLGTITTPNIIKDLRADGFQIGTDTTVNANLVNYRFAAWKASSTKLAFTVQTSNTTAGASVTPAVKVAVQDADGNTDLTDNSTTVTMAISNNPGGGTLSGTLTQTAASGVATFNNLSIDKTGTGYTLAATATGRTSAESTSFNIIPAAANKLAFSAQPTQAVAGITITPEVKVTVQDSFGNKVASDSSTSITVAILNNPGSGTLSGTLTKTAVSGEATFSDLSINKSGTGYTLSATATGLTVGASNGFNIVPAAAAQLAFTTQPASTAAGSIITPPIKIAIEDSFGNVASSDNSSQITLAILNNPSSATLFGTRTKTVASGEATFSDIYLNQKGDGFTLTGTCAGLTTATSGAFSITGAIVPPAIQTLYPSRDAYNIPTGAQITLTFDQAMDQSSVNGAFSLKAIRDNTGTSLDAISVAGTTSWDAASQIFSFIPSSLNKGYTYRSALTTSARSADLIYLATAESSDFVVIYDRSRSNTIYSVDRLVRVTLAAGSIPVDGTVKINRSPRTAPDYVDPDKITAANDKVLAEHNAFHYPLSASITEFNLIDSTGTRVTTRFAESATLALYYDGTDPLIQEKQLILCRLDEDHGLWVKVPDSAVNETDNFVYAPVHTLSVYTIMSTPALSAANVYAFPNPFKPSLGHTTVTFTNLPAICTIRVYTLTGDTVVTLNETNGDGQYVWDVKNDGGQLLQSGMYLYIVKSAGDTKTGKLVIVR